MSQNSPESREDLTQPVILSCRCFASPACLRSEDIGLCGRATAEDGGKTICNYAEYGLGQMADSYAGKHIKNPDLLPIAAIPQSDYQVDLCTVVGRDPIQLLATLISGRITQNQESIPVPKIDP